MAMTKPDEHTNGAVVVAEGIVTTTPSPLDLSDAERLLLLGIAARQQEVQRLVNLFNADTQRTDALLEQAHGLPPGAIGTTHRVNFDAMRLEVVAG